MEKLEMRPKAAKCGKMRPKSRKMWPNVGRRAGLGSWAQGGTGSTVAMDEWSQRGNEPLPMARVLWERALGNRIRPLSVGTQQPIEMAIFLRVGKPRIGQMSVLMAALLGPPIESL